MEHEGRLDGSHYDTVVVGSGFGGAITARRLAEAGGRVLMLERGERWRPGDFSRDSRDTDRIFWLGESDRSARGYFDLRFFSGLGVACAAGVGGGSLVYANIHVRPDAGVFEDPRWPAEFTRAALDPYYDKVAAALGIAPAPAEFDLPKRRRFEEAARGLGWSTFSPDQAVAWQDPHEPGRKACQLCSECQFGCNHGAKNTLDFNYLPAAERAGAVIAPGIRVRSVAPASGRGYQVNYERARDGQKGQVTARRVVLAAGTLGTLEILLRSRRMPHGLPAISSRLGFGFSANGDFLGSIQNAREDFAPWKGPDVTTVATFTDEVPRFTLAAPSFNRAAMEVLAAMGQGDGGIMRHLPTAAFRTLGAVIPKAFRSGLLSAATVVPGPGAGPPGRMTHLFAIGQDNAGGRVVWDDDSIDIEWRFLDENRPLVQAMIAAMEQLAQAYGGTYAPLMTWSLFERPLTVHPLGGCNLSTSPATGVVDIHGQVHGYPGLYIADGSVIPTAIGYHPVMTIAAVAEKIAEGLAESR